MNYDKKFLFFLIFLISLTFISCKDKKKNDPTEDPAEAFDKKGMHTYYADAVIHPSYTTFSISLDSLTICYNDFKLNNSVLKLQELKSKFITAYLKYQRCDLFELGPAETESIRANFNIFPTDTIQIKSNILAGSYDLSAVSNLDAKGFPAIEYLFFGSNQTESLIAQSFTITNKKQYVTDLLTEMRTKLNNVISAWNGQYKNTFTNSMTTDIGSSIGNLINQLNYNLDYLKNAKLGIPLGKRSLGVPYPDKCESYYNGNYSVRYALETFDLIERVYSGKSFSGSNGLGFDDYLEHLKTPSINGTLNNAIKDQFTVTRVKLQAIADPLSTQITAAPAVVDAAYAELVKLLVLLKTDLPSALGVVITYQDGDGD